MEKAVSFWQDKRVLLTGGAGFLGSYVVQMLRDRGCRELLVPQRDFGFKARADLREGLGKAVTWYEDVAKTQEMQTRS